MSFLCNGSIVDDSLFVVAPIVGGVFVFGLVSSTEPLAHGELLLSLDVQRPSSTIASKDISSLTNSWSWTKLGRNDPYITLFSRCSNGSGPLHI